MRCQDCGREGFERLAQHLALTECEYPEFSEQQEEIIVGTLMGDATLSHYEGNSKNAQYILRMIKPSYLKHVVSLMPDWFATTESVGIIETAEESWMAADSLPHGKGKRENYSDYYGFQSKRHPRLTELKNKWYDGENKVFPSDLTLTPRILKHWYVTDGNINYGSENYYRAVFNSANENHRPEFVKDLFSDVGYDARYDGAHKFRLTGESSRAFFDTIGGPPPGFSYKWPE